MINRREAAIIQWVSSGQYEKALEIPFDAGRSEIARAHIRKLHLCASSPSAREHLNRAKSALLEETPLRKANRLLSIDEPVSALAILQQSLTESSAASEHHLIGYVLLRLNRYNDAVLYMEKAFALAPTPFNAIWLGQTYEHMNLRENALEKYLEAIAQRGSETEYRLAGNLCFHMGDLEAALSYLGKAIEAGCTDVEITDRIGSIRHRLRVKQFTASLRRFFHFSKTAKR